MPSPLRSMYFATGESSRTGVRSWMYESATFDSASSTPSCPATARGAAPTALPIRWSVGTPTYENQPVLVGDGVIITTDNTATRVGLASGNQVWRVVHPDQAGLHFTVGAPTLYSGMIDASFDT